MPAAPLPDLLVILGPTASGKTRLAVALARGLGGEIVSADSRQLYRGMDIGTGKDREEYGAVPCHLIDVADPRQPWDLHAYQTAALAAVAAIHGRGALPLLVGGSGLYLEAVLEGYQLVPAPENPALRAELAALSMDALVDCLTRLRPRPHNTTDLLERDRLVRAIEIAEAAARAPPAPPAPMLHPLVLGLRWPRPLLRRRIEERLRRRLREGLVAEARRLLDQGVGHDLLEHYGLEYRFLARHLRGELNRNDLTQKLTAAICDFAKRQESWFRRMERNGLRIHWLDATGDLQGSAWAVLEEQGLRRAVGREGA
ncbi:MAG: tRNA (adenosine(37)-N6)-dimethylallyltransferase MiaA [Magnetococcales bacterium]|nr:tRNA (adenosine(37)-N6)-dimethylallyltransferase MiaA [Magnetococcales bacterium]